MNFLEYLSSKKIDALPFKKGEPSIYEEWELHFEEMHPKSFTAQKLYLINDIRRRFLLVDETKVENKKKASPKAVIPGIKKSIKILPKGI